MGRMDEFYGGSNTGLGTANYQTSTRPFHADSVIQQYLPSGNGLSNQDSMRRTLGPVGQNMLPTQNGQNATTYQARQPLENQYRTFG